MREGGNAADAAIAAVAASLVVESPLTGLGAGGYMLFREPGAEPVLLDFFVAAPGIGAEGLRRRAELVPIEIDFGGTVQVFNIGAASCGVPGVPAGLAEAASRFATMPLADLVGPAVRLAREGVVVNDQQGYLFALLAPILNHAPEGAAVYSPRGRPLRAGETFVYPELGEALELYGAEGAAPFYEGDIAGRLCAWVGERGGTLTAEDLRSYAPIAREPVHAAWLGRDVVSNAPPSPGGTLIAFVLAILERLGRSDPAALVAAMEQAQLARDRDFLEGLYGDGFADSFLRRRSARCGRRGLRPDAGATGAPPRAGAARGRARLDHPYRRRRRRRRLRERHLLERLGLGRDRAGHRRAAQQHDGRAGPEPARLPQHAAGPADAVDDVADRRPA